MLNLFVFWQIGLSLNMLKISAILLKYPAIDEVFFHISMSKTKTKLDFLYSFCVFVALGIYNFELSLSSFYIVCAM